MSIAGACSYQRVLDVVNSASFAEHVASYYQNLVSPTIDGMLGGLAYVHPAESLWSQKYLNSLVKRKVIQDKAVLDVGGGIGRVSTYVLRPIFKRVDMLEQNARYVDESKVNFAKDAIKERYCMPVQRLGEITTQYSVLWIQWVVGHINDLEFVQLLQNARKLAAKIIIKDNYCRDGFWFDEKDGNILRSIQQFEDIFKAAGLTIIEQKDPETWPKDLMPIRVWLL